MQFTTTFKEVSHFYNTGFRDLTRQVVLDMLSWVTQGQQKAYLEKPRIQFLYFHHVFQDEAENFEKLVRCLASDHTFISHTEAVNRLIHGTIDRPYIAWSSDDGLENNRVAAKILKRYGASCCFFINPKTIGLDDFQAIKKFCATKINMPPVPFMSWSNVATLLKDGHEIGSHTMNHDRVLDLTPGEFKEDLQESKEILESHCGTIRHFAYPYGRFSDFSAQAHAQVFEAGYESCSTAVRGCHVRHGGALQKKDVLIRRDQVVGAWPLAHVRYFLMRASKNARSENNVLPNTYLK